MKALSSYTFRDPQVMQTIREIVNNVKSLELAVSPEQLDLSDTMVILRGLKSLPVRLGI